MKTDQQNDFAALRRLLKLKRYEQPPPRYFNDFSSQVITRIKLNPQGDADSVLDPIPWLAPWVERLINTLLRKPIVAGGFAAAACAVLLGGLIYSEVGGASPGPTVTLQAPPPEKRQSPPAAFALGESVMLNSSTNPIHPLTGSIFDAINEQNRLVPQPQAASGTHSIVP